MYTKKEIIERIEHAASMVANDLKKIRPENLQNKYQRYISQIDIQDLINTRNNLHSYHYKDE
jgi:hypothetical protein